MRRIAARYLKQILPEGLFRRAQRFGFARRCVCCGSWLQRFEPWPKQKGRGKYRAEARCPICGSLERHRSMWLFFKKAGLFDGRPKSVLHVAPEQHLSDALKRQPGVTYVSVDLVSPRAMVHTDVTALPLPDASFDVVLCSHVLEHIPDEQAAMRELRRVLKPTGWALLQVPIVRERTFEDPTIKDAAGRLAAYGQEDHVRAYGLDFVDRLRAARFHVDITPATQGMSAASIKRFGLAAVDLYVCRR